MLCHLIPNIYEDGIVSQTNISSINYVVCHLAATIENNSLVPYHFVEITTTDFGSRVPVAQIYLHP